MADIAVKSGATLKQKYVNRAQAASGDYQSGVNNTTKSQTGNAIAAKSRMVSGFNAALNAGIWEKKLAAAGDGKWKANSASKGAARYGDGVSHSQDVWAASVQPYFDTLNSLSLPPRAMRGDPSNQARSTAVQQALHSKRMNSGQ